MLGDHNRQAIHPNKVDMPSATKAVTTLITFIIDSK
tara:strand:+ start:106471 stop:106578 length:108 start_codon:yes stop_codon:yes gene_type:complete